MRQFIERILDERQRALELQFAESRRANEAATIALNLRLEQMNEFRAQINGERANYVRREQLDMHEKESELRIKALEDSRSNLDGRFWALGWALGGGLTALTIAMNMLSKRTIPSLTRKDDK